MILSQPIFAEIHSMKDFSLRFKVKKSSEKGDV
jgi:hypothetical protein